MELKHGNAYIVRTRNNFKLYLMELKLIPEGTKIYETDTLNCTLWN